MAEVQFRRLASFQYSMEALIVKGKLESEGIVTYIRDNHTIDTNPLLSNAVGGVKLYVAVEDYERAAAIYSEINTFSTDDQDAEIICPSCGGNKVSLYTTVRQRKAFLSFMLSLFIFGGLPIYIKYIYRCDSCSTEFERE